MTYYNEFDSCLDNYNLYAKSGSLSKHLNLEAACQESALGTEKSGLLV